MELDCYKIHDVAPELVPGNAKRAWMDAFPDRHPYRCLPLTMANSTGWDILCPIDFTVEWTGGPDEKDIRLYSRPEDAGHLKSFATSHFRRGIVTFHTGYLFRTPPGWGVWAMGSPNVFKDGIAPLTGLIETDWLPFPFTMNWQMTRPGKVKFKKGESFCFLTLMEHHKLEEIQPTVKRLAENKDLHREYTAWQTSRSDFNKKLQSLDAKTVKEGWQRHYMRGETAAGSEGGPDHITKRRLKTPSAE